MRSRLWRRATAGVVVLVACNEGLAPTPTPTTCPPGFVGICGTVTVAVPLPDSLRASTDAVFIVAYPHFPLAAESLFNFYPQLATIPAAAYLSGSPYFYTLRLPNGRYEWVLAVWKRTGTLTAQNADTLLREVGFYRDAGDTTSHGSGIVVVNSTGTDSIDFVLDFANMHRICTYFPPCP